MKKFLVTCIFLVLGIVVVSAISPYIRVAELSGEMYEVVSKVKTVLNDAGYDIIGDHQPGNNPDLYVLVFTSDELVEFSQGSKDRGILTAAMKVGFQRTEGKIIVSIVNPEYLFYAYFRELMSETSFKSSAMQISSEIKSTMRGVGNVMEPFGGDLTEKELIKYRYMAGMPDFDKTVNLAEFESFDKGVVAIQKGLSAEGSTVKVYEIINESGKTALFGVGLMDKEEGEAHFLPIIGESHVAAMPYEIILQGNKATMLHGRYRFALHWPERTMRTFTKIMSSPGDVEDAMLSLFETD
ncbi:MAG: hypothetical protein KAS29_16360 [Bacteroidales bacterium]|nr:hypothetical protein [Bacteroidales bacterium]